MTSSANQSNGATPDKPAVSDDGSIIQFPSGAVRSSDRVGYRWDLMSPIALARYAAACGEGSDKYGDFNWEKGMPVNEILNHCIAHINAWLAGDRSEDHLGHAMWNIAAAIHSDVCWPELNSGAIRKAGCVPPVVCVTQEESEKRAKRVAEAMGF